MFFGRTDANAETSILWPSHVKIDSLESALVMGGIGGRKRRGQKQDDIFGWHHLLDGRESE